MTEQEELQQLRDRVRELEDREREAFRLANAAIYLVAPKYSLHAKLKAFMDGMSSPVEQPSAGSPEAIPADLTRVVDISNVRGSQPLAIAKILSPMADGLREQGYKWFRITAPGEGDNVYLQAWRERPMVDGVLREGAIDRSKAEVFAS